MARSGIGIDYNLITNLGGAEARGQGQALDLQTKEAALTDYLAQTQGRRAVGGGDLAGFYEQDIRTKNYQNEIQSVFPLLVKGIAAGDQEGVQALNESLKAKYPNDHNVSLTGMIPGQSADMETIKTGAKIMEENPEMQGRIDPAASYTESSTITADGQVQITGVKPAGVGKVGLEEWEPWGHGQKRNRRTGVIESIPVKPDGAGGPGGVGGSASSLKWDKDALGALKTQYGTLTDTGYVIDTARMSEYQDAVTYLNDYKAKGLGPNEASVLSERRSKAGGVDPIQTVIDRYKAQGKSDTEIKGFLRKSQFKSVNPRNYGLK